MQVEEQASGWMRISGLFYWIGILVWLVGCDLRTQSFTPGPTRGVMITCDVGGRSERGTSVCASQQPIKNGIYTKESPTPPVKLTATALIPYTRVPTPTSTATCTTTPILAEPSARLTAIRADNGARVRQVGMIRFKEWEPATSIAWSPDGEILAIAAGERVYIYGGQPLPDGEWHRLVELYVGALTPALSFSPDGRWLAVGSRDGMVRVWSLATVLNGTQQPDWQFVAHKKGVNSITFSPSSEQLASGGNDAVARIWEPVSGELLEASVGGTHTVPSIVFTPDGLMLAIVNGEMIRLRRVGSGLLVGSFRAQTQLFSAAFSPDGVLLAAGDHDNQVLLWEVTQAYRSGQETYPEAVKLEGHAGRKGSFQALIWQVVFSPDGGVLASAGGDGLVWLWDIVGKAALVRLSGHTAGVSGVAFSPDGSFLGTCGLDHTTRFWAVGE